MFPGNFYIYTTLKNYGMKKSKQQQREDLSRYNADQQKTNELKGNFVAYFDGACEPRNPGGNMGVGATIRNAGKELFQYSTFVAAARNNTNNVAEYMAFEAILDFLHENPIKDITIYGDSNLVIEQMFGIWKMKSGFYIPFAKRCKDKIAFLRSTGMKINGIWIRREQNTYADELSKRELINHNVQFKIQPLSLNPSN
jgi:ribonuclease HI